MNSGDVKISKGTLNVNFVIFMKSCECYYIPTQHSRIKSRVSLEHLISSGNISLINLETVAATK